MKQKILRVLSEFADLPPVLCHGDLSSKNVMIQKNGDVVLIDWDDAIAYNWMVDISRMTYSEEDYSHFRKVFLTNYQTDYRKADFDRFEEIYHLYNALDNLRFYIITENPDMQKRIIKYVDTICG